MPIRFAGDGFDTAESKVEDAITICYLEVEPRYQDRGILEKLLKKFIDMVAGDTTGPIYFYVPVNETSTVTLFKNQGFTVDELLPCYYYEGYTVSYCSIQGIDYYSNEKTRDEFNKRNRRIAHAENKETDKNLDAYRMKYVASTHADTMKNRSCCISK